MEFLSLDNIAIRDGETIRFARVNWTWKQGEQWSILGSDDSGKSLLVQALQGQVPLAAGEIRGPFDRAGNEEADPAEVIAVVSPETQRQAAMTAGSFYQSRWHCGLEQTDRTVADLLSQANVERRNPFEVGARHGNGREFLRLRRQYLDALGATRLWRRPVAHLSNGELRKVLLVEALLRRPRLLILEECSAGLDIGTRWVWKGVRARGLETCRSASSAWCCSRGRWSSSRVF